MLEEQRGSQYGSIATTLWGMDILLEMLENARTKSKPNDIEFQDTIDLAWTLLQRYYSKTDDSPVHLTSIILDPHLKFSYCNCQWEKKWTGAVKEKMLLFYDRYRWIYGHRITDVSDIEDRVETEQARDMRLFDVNKWRFGDMK